MVPSEAKEATCLLATGVLLQEDRNHSLNPHPYTPNHKLLNNIRRLVVRCLISLAPPSSLLRSGEVLLHYVYEVLLILA